LLSRSKRDDLVTRVGHVARNVCSDGLDGGGSGLLTSFAFALLVLWGRVIVLGAWAGFALALGVVLGGSARHTGVVTRSFVVLPVAVVALVLLIAILALALLITVLALALLVGVFLVVIIIIVACVGLC
jgi:hypothetical protein